MDPQNQNQHNQQQQYNPYANAGFGMPLPSVPNATAVMILGICSIVLCTIGPILGTIALVLAKGAKREYEANPGKYDASSYSNVNTGRICGMIGVIVGALAWIGMICYFIFWIWLFSEVSHGMKY